MTDRQLPTIDYLHKRLRYEPDTGNLFWRDCEDMPNSWRAVNAGKQAFAYSSRGYKMGKIDGVSHRAHRVAYAMHHGKWPANQIDHIDGCRSNNCADNLREVTHKENHRNKSMPSTNTSGVVGVRWNKRIHRWGASIIVDGRVIYLGHFKDIGEAAQARAEGAAKFGFSERHGAKRLASSVNG
jgi:hypothetical protein